MIAGCSRNDMFTGLQDAQVRDAPSYFIEFWRPEARALLVIARRVEHRDRKNGILYTSRNRIAVARQVPGGLPSLAQAARVDDKIAQMILDARGQGRRFLSPEALIEALDNL